MGEVKELLKEHVGLGQQYYYRVVHFAGNRSLNGKKESGTDVRLAKHDQIRIKC